MSKLRLKKELQALDKEQLIQLVLDAFDARRETKEYFEFFLNPDIGKLRAKSEIAISKELNRSRRGGYCKARISYIRQMIKDFASFHPGFEEHLDLLFYTVSYAMLSELHLNFSDTLERGIASLLQQIVDIADLNGVASQTMERLGKLLGNERAGSRYFRNYLAAELQKILTSPTLKHVT